MLKPIFEKVKGFIYFFLELPKGINKKGGEAEVLEYE